MHADTRTHLLHICKIPNTATGRLLDGWKIRKTSHSSHYCIYSTKVWNKNMIFPIAEGPEDTAALVLEGGEIGICTHSLDGEFNDARFASLCFQPFIAACKRSYRFESMLLDIGIGRVCAHSSDNTIEILIVEERYLGG